MQPIFMSDGNVLSGRARLRVPTAGESLWELADQTLTVTADVTLQVGGAQATRFAANILYLDLDADWAITLPAAAGWRGKREIVNISSGAFTATIKNSAGSTIAQIDSGEGGVVFSDGTTVRARGYTANAVSGNDFGVDGIKADKVDESTSGTGVTVDGMLIKDKQIDVSALLTGEPGLKLPANKADAFSAYDSTGDLFVLRTTTGDLGMRLADGVDFELGNGSDDSVVHSGTETTWTHTTGDLIFDNTDVDDQIILRVGTDTNATGVEIRNNSDAAIVAVTPRSATEGTLDLNGLLDQDAALTATGDAANIAATMNHASQIAEGLDVSIAQITNVRTSGSLSAIKASVTSFAGTTAGVDHYAFEAAVTVGEATADHFALKQGAGFDQTIDSSAAATTETGWLLPANKADALSVGDSTGDVFFVDTTTGDLSFNIPDGVDFELGNAADDSVVHNGTDTIWTHTTGDLVFDSVDVDDQIVFRVGTDTNATGFEFRNNSDAAVWAINPSSATAGTLKGLDGSALVLGTGDDDSVAHDGSDTLWTHTTGNLKFDNTSATKSTIFVLGADTDATAFEVQNNSTDGVFTVDGAGHIQAGGGMWVGCPSEADPDPSVAHRFFEDFLALSTDWTVTEDTTDCTQAVSDAQHGVLVLTNKAGTDNNAQQVQYAQETFKLTSGKKLWAEFRVKIVGDATESDLFIGLAEAEDLTGVADIRPANGFGFAKDDGDANIDAASADNGTDIAGAAVGTLVNDTWIRLGLLFDGGASGAATITPYIDGVAGTPLAAVTYATMAEVSPILVVRNGDGVTTEVLHCDYVKVVTQR